MSTQLKSSAASRIQANLQELFEANVASGDAYIKFQLTPKVVALLSMGQVQESLIVEAAKITPLPSMPKSTLGMMNSRDRVFCIFDLAQLLTLSTELISSRQYQIIVVKTMNEPPIMIGFAVSQLQGIERLAAEKINSSSDDTPPNLVRFLSGVVEQEESMLPIIELNLVLNALTALS
jgi:positive phototaxis protein PixI